MGSFQYLSGKRLEEYKRELCLNTEQVSVLVGSTLGDANLRIMKSHAIFTCEHSSIQKDYVFWKYGIFKNWVLTPPREESRKYHKDISRRTVSWKFQTVSHPLVTSFYHQFYLNGKKIVPKEIGKWLTPLALAVWYMDDGSRKPYGKGAFFHTQNFSLEDQAFLIELLKEKFGLEAHISSHGWWKEKQLFRLYITAGSFPLLKNIISPYILPMFSYKTR